MSVEVSPSFPSLNKRTSASGGYVSNTTTSATKRRLATSFMDTGENTSTCQPNMSAKRGLSEDYYYTNNHHKKKTFRNLNAELSDEPQLFTQQQVDFFEQKKKAEMAKICCEYDQLVWKKDQAQAQLSAELDQTKHVVSLQAQGLEKLSQENQILKRAVGIQNQQKVQAQAEMGQLQARLTQAIDQIRKLEQTNYALKVHLQSNDSMSGNNTTFFPPPNVY